ncbi:hypothetical protein [Leptolyngbya ohadii]|uniref:hypothetical protein n=1 Tax=Leptolyngbya ohadii TaxID=1962290 RepID=UPI00117BA293|nr:hypothetical protein [Leptolyngbya ohadii]
MRLWHGTPLLVRIRLSFRVTPIGLQAESLVECFQAEMWNGFEASENFWEVLEITCSQRSISAPSHITESDLQQVRSRLRTYTEHWNALAMGETLVVTFSS